LERRERARTEAIEKRVRLAVATEQHVLAVVHALAGFAIDERGGATAQPRRFFDNDDAPAGAGEMDRGAQPGETRADHDDVCGKLVHAWLKSD
jgi:hypothetical protein